MIKLLADFSKGSGIEIEFLNFEYTDLLDRVEAEQKAGRIVLNLIADLQTDLSSVEFECNGCSLIHEELSKVVEKNFQIGKKHLSLEKLQQYLTFLFNRLGLSTG